MAGLPAIVCTHNFVRGLLRANRRPPTGFALAPKAAERVRADVSERQLAFQYIDWTAEGKRVMAADALA